MTFVRMTFVRMTFSLTTFSLMTFSLTTFSLMTFSLTTFSLTTFSIVTLCITIKSRHSINNIQHINVKHHFAECCLLMCWLSLCLMLSCWVSEPQYFDNKIDFSELFYNPAVTLARRLGWYLQNNLWVSYDCHFSRGTLSPVQEGLLIHPLVLKVPPLWKMILRIYMNYRDLRSYYNTSCCGNYYHRYTN